jgi:hypothetical protein
MSDNKDFIIDDYDFIKPEFVTTKEECYRLISQAYNATQALEKYRIALVHKIAELTKQKVFRLKTEYDNTQCYDYFVGKNKEELEDEVSGICDEVICFDEGYPGSMELVKDYSHE